MEEKEKIHWFRWLATAAVTAAVFAGVVLPLQAIEILHLGLYEATLDPKEHFMAVSMTICGAAVFLGLANGGLGVVREAFLHEGERRWPLWGAVLSTTVAALTVHVLEVLALGTLALLPHASAAWRGRETRWRVAGMLAVAFLAAPFTDPVRQLYAKRVIRVFHNARERYMDIFLQTRKGGARPGQGDYKGYLRSIEDLPVTPRELLWLGIVSVTHDPWGKPYRFQKSRAMMEGSPRPDFGRWDADYIYESLGADGVPGGTGYDEDLSPENALPLGTLPPPRPKMHGPEPPPAPKE